MCSKCICRKRSRDSNSEICILNWMDRLPVFFFRNVFNVQYKNATTNTTLIKSFIAWKFSQLITACFALNALLHYAFFLDSNMYGNKLIFKHISYSIMQSLSLCKLFINQGMIMIKWRLCKNESRFMPPTISYPNC